MIVNEAKDCFGFDTEEELLEWAAAEVLAEVGVTIDTPVEGKYEMWTVGGGGCCEDCYSEDVMVDVEFYGLGIATFKGTYTLWGSNHSWYLKDKSFVKYEG